MNTVDHAELIANEAVTVMKELGNKLDYEKFYRMVRKKTVEHLVKNDSDIIPENEMVEIFKRCEL